MNINQLKIKMFLLRALDTVLVLSLMGAGIFSVFYADNKELMLIACLVGLFFVNILGRATNHKVAVMGVQLEMLKREKKTEDQRTLMATRHSTTRVTKNTVVKTTPTNSATKK